MFETNQRRYFDRPGVGTFTGEANAGNAAPPQQVQSTITSRILALEARVEDQGRALMQLAEAFGARITKLEEVVGV